MSEHIGFQHFAEKDPDFIAIVDPDGRQWSRGALTALVNRLACAFLDKGLRRGDTVAIVSPNCAEYVAVYLGATHAGLQVVPVNWHLAENEIAFILDDCEAQAIVVHDNLGSRLRDAIVRSRGHARLMLSIGNADGYLPLEDFCAPFPSERVDTPEIGRMMAYTSATTGRPKAVLLPVGNGRAALARRVEANRHVGILPEDGNVNLCASMLYHSAPLGGVELALHMGHRVVLVGRWEAEKLLALIHEHHVTTTFLVPTMFVRLVKLPQTVKDRYSIASLRFVAHGAAPCPAEIKRQMIAWWGEVIWESYGATEAQGTIVNSQDWLRFPGTVGKPLPGSEVRILDDEGTERPPGEIGHIYLKPHTGDRFEYKGDPEKTKQSYRGEFITAGDLGYVNEQGYLFVCDRSSDLIISSGMNIYPAEIESVLVQHPHVLDCAVIGEAHELLGCVPKAFVQLDTNAASSPRLKAELLMYAAKQLSAAKLPKRIEFVTTIPRDPNGKLMRRRLQGGR